MRRWRHLPLRRPAPGGLAAAREPPRCDIVTVRTATMSHRGGCGAVAGAAGSRREGPPGPAGREGCRRTARPGLHFASGRLTPEEPHPRGIHVVPLGTRGAEVTEVRSSRPRGADRSSAEAPGRANPAPGRANSAPGRQARECTAGRQRQVFLATVAEAALALERAPTAEIACPLALRDDETPSIPAGRAARSAGRQAGRRRVMSRAPGTNRAASWRAGARRTKERTVPQWLRSSA